MEYRWSSTQEGWWDEIKEQININRPIFYRVNDHFIVCDGWKIWPEAPTEEERYYHMNYGESDANNHWWPLDELYLGGILEEVMCRFILPDESLGTELSGTYPINPFFPYRYFDMDAVNYGSGGVSAIFEAGQFLQFLPEVTAMSTGSSTYLEFQGNPGNITRLFTNGDTSRGIKISNGAIRHTNGGTVKLYKREGY